MRRLQLQVGCHIKSIEREHYNATAKEFIDIKVNKRDGMGFTP